MIDQSRSRRVSQANRDPLNQAALLQLRKVKRRGSPGVLHVLSLMRWWLDQNGPSLGEEQDGVEARLTALMEADPAQAMQFLQDPEQTGDQALNPRDLERERLADNAGWLLVDALMSAMLATDDPLQSSWTAR